MQPKPVTEVPRTFFLFFFPCERSCQQWKVFSLPFFLFSTKHTNVEMKFQLPENFFFLVFDDT